MIKALGDRGNFRGPVRFDRKSLLRRDLERRQIPRLKRFGCARIGA